METALSLAMFAAIALAAGSFYLWRSRGMSRQAVLMLILSAVLAINVAIWTLPNQKGESLVSTAPE